MLCAVGRSRIEAPPQLAATQLVHVRPMSGQVAVRPMSWCCCCLGLFGSSALVVCNCAFWVCVMTAPTGMFCVTGDVLIAVATPLDRVGS